MTTSYEIRPIGHVESSLVDRESAPKQGFEGAPDAWLVFEPGVSVGLRDLAVGDAVFVLTLAASGAARCACGAPARRPPKPRDRSVQHPVPGQAESDRSAPGPHRRDRLTPRARAGSRSFRRNTHRGREAGAHRGAVNDGVLRVTLARWWRRSEVGDLLLLARSRVGSHPRPNLGSYLCPRQESDERDERRRARSCRWRRRPRSGHVGDAGPALAWVESSWGESDVTWAAESLEGTTSPPATRRFKRVPVCDATGAGRAVVPVSSRSAQARQQAALGTSQVPARKIARAQR
jgi:hypothetical protein